MSLPIAVSSPRQSSVAGFHPYRQRCPDIMILHDQHGRAMDQNWIGPCRPIDFIKKLMRTSDKHLHRLPTDVEFSQVPAHCVEKDVCHAFNTTVEKSKLCPHFPYFISVNLPVKNIDILYRPDGGFKEHQDAFLANEDKSRYWDWCNSGLLVKFTSRADMDPFLTREEIRDAVTARRQGADDLKVAFGKDSDDATILRGQLTMYALQMFSHQHRLHLFQLLICGEIARFLFWDHSGAIVSDRFDYTVEPSLLVEFLWRYNHMSAAARGIDSTATRASSEDAKVFTAAVEEFLTNMRNADHPQRELPHAGETLNERYPVYRITVGDDISEKSVDVLVQRPFFRHFFIGRGTRAYLAYAITERELLFLKDTWRVVHDRLIPERKVCADLENAEIPTVSGVLCGGDVKPNGTRGRTRCLLWAKVLKQLPLGYSALRIFQHHRLLQKLAYPVECAPYSRQFVIAFCDCLKAMDLALKKCGIVHGDISLGNVMLDASVAAKGILTDWDHSGKEKLRVSDGQNHQYFRTGTWQFMSIAMLEDPKKPHEALDDFESVFWALLYGALHRFNHTNRFLYMGIFHEKHAVVLSDGSSAYIGGAGKSAALGNIHTNISFISPPLQTLLCRLACEWETFYRLRNKVSTIDAIAARTRDVQDLPLVDEVPFEPSRRATRTPKAKESPSPDESPAVIRARYEALRTKLSNAKHWINIFYDALTQKGWLYDVVPDPYPRQSVKHDTQLHEKAAHSDFVSAQEPGAPDEDTMHVEDFQVDQKSASSKINLSEPDSTRADGTGECRRTTRQPSPPVVPHDGDAAQSQHCEPSYYLRSKRSICDVEDDESSSHSPHPSRPTKKLMLSPISANAAKD